MKVHLALSIRVDLIGNKSTISRDVFKTPFPNIC